MTTQKKNSARTAGIIIAACLLYMASAGLRTVFGVLLNVISAGTGIAYAEVSSAIAIAQLVFGISQPVFGVIANKTSKRFVLMLGCLFMGAGLILIPFCKSFLPLVGTLGVIFPIGTGAVSFGMIMSVVSPLLGEKKAIIASGLVNASSGVGGIILSPVIQGLYDMSGLLVTMLVLAIYMIILIFVSGFMCGKPKEAAGNLIEREHAEATGSITESEQAYTAKNEEVSVGKTSEENNDVKNLLAKAFKNKSYLALVWGFFTCGYHMGIVETHLFSQLVSYGMSESFTAIAFSIYGAAVMLGCLICGFLCNEFSMKNVLTGIFGSRVIWPVILIFMPKNEVTIMMIVILLGLTGAASMTPTSGLTEKLFGADNLATLFGVVFLSHQVGSFFSAWIGGLSVELTGDYVMVWAVAVVLSAIAAVAVFRIKD